LVANEEVGRLNYRRSRILGLTTETNWFIITAVCTNSADSAAIDYPEGGRALRGRSRPSLRRDHSGRPTGFGSGTEGVEWLARSRLTAPEPGSRHFPEVRGGALIALFYLPAGRIGYAEP
jgi:hypothetical protein